MKGKGFGPLIPCLDQYLSLLELWKYAPTATHTIETVVIGTKLSDILSIFNSDDAIYLLIY